ncbi:MAG: hypothetical protein AB7O56_15160 [Bauldia sp.]
MKTKDFAKAIDAYAAALASAGGWREAAALAALSANFERTPAATVTAALKRLAALPDHREGGAPTFAGLMGILEPLGAVLAVAGKAAAVTDFKALAALARARPHLTIAALVAPAAAERRTSSKPKPSVRADVVADYVRRLERALGSDPQFTVVHAELEKSLTARELIALAKEFAGETTRSGATALKKIWGRHHALLDFRSKSAATSGRTAA